MGFELSWQAIQGRSVADILRDARLQDTGQKDEYLEAPIAGGMLPSGWYVVLDVEMTLVEDNVSVLLSRRARLLTTIMSEGAASSLAAEWREGRKVWEVSHDGSTAGAPPLTIVGRPPVELAGLRTRAGLLRLLPGVDFMFDVPIDLAAKFTGFRPDRQMPHREFSRLKRI